MGAREWLKDKWDRIRRKLKRQPEKDEEEQEGKVPEKKKILWRGYRREGAVTEILYEEDGEIKTIIVAPGPEGKGGTGTVVGTGGGGSFTKTKLYAFSDDDVKKAISEQTGVPMEELPNFEEIKSPPLVNYYHRMIDEKIETLIEQHLGSDQIPAEDYKYTYAEIEDILEFNKELRDVMRIIEPFEEIHYELLYTDKGYVEVAKIQKAKESKERYFKHRSEYEDVIEGNV